MAADPRYKDLAAFNKWRGYRNERLWTQEEFDIWMNELKHIKYFTKDRYIPDHQVTPWSGWPKVKRRVRGRYTVPLNQLNLQNTFLETEIPELGSGWEGKRILGAGTYGTVGLFEYNGNSPNRNIGKHVAVKVANKSYADLTDEADFMERFTVRPTSHIVRIITRGVPEIAEGAWKGKVRRIILEYCPHGSLHDLIVRRYIMAEPFSEATLWLMFRCLIDALSVMETGSEALEAESPAVQDDIKGYWQRVVHFDLKPGNMFLGERDGKHPVTPIVKTGDFGLAQLIPKKRDFRPWERIQNRWRGTQGFKPPEHFTERWDYANWVTSDIAGHYTPKHNIWVMGAIMYQMMLCDPRATVKVDQAFLPQTLSNWHARGITYGKELLDLPYSDLLKHLILECLYERPSLRLDLSILRSRAQLGFHAAGGETAVDTWDLFICPDPIEPPGLQKTATKAPPPPASGYPTAFLVAPRVAPPISNPQNIPVPSPGSTFSSTELNQQSPANPAGGPNIVQPLYGVAPVILSVANNFTPQPAPNLGGVSKTAAQSSSSQLLTRQGHRQSQQASLSRNRTETSFDAPLVRQERRQHLHPAMSAGVSPRNHRGSSSKAMSNLNARIEALEVGTGSISNGSNISSQGRVLPQTFEDASKGSNISTLLHGMVPSNPTWQGGENAGVGIMARSDADTSTDSGSGSVVFAVADKTPRSKRRRLGG